MQMIQILLNFWMDQNIFSANYYTPVVTAALFYVKIKVSTTESIQKHHWHYDHILLVLTVAGSDCCKWFLKTTEEDHEKEITVIL